MKKMAVYMHMSCCTWSDNGAFLKEFLAWVSKIMLECQTGVQA